MSDPQTPVPPPLIAPPTVRGALVRERQPVWPNVIGIIGLIYGIAGAVFSVLEIVQAVVFRAIAGVVENQSPETFDAISKWMPATLALAIVSVVLAIVLIAASWAMLVHKPWCRPVVNIWAVLKIVSVVAATIVGYCIQRDVLASGAAPGAPTILFDGLFVLTAVMTLAMYAGFPIFMLVWMNLSGPKRDMARWRPGNAQPSPQP